MQRPVFAIRVAFGLAVAFLFAGVLAGPGIAANNYYSVPIGFTWDHLSYDTNPGDYNVSLGDSGFDAGAIPGNTGTNDNGPSVSITNNDGLHGFSGIPFIIGPTQDGYSNVSMGEGQAVPVVPGKYKALYVSYSAVNGPHHRAVILNYTDGVEVIPQVWADWCAATQAPPDFFTWTAKHRNNATGQDNNSCSLITKYVLVNPNRTLVGVTLGFDAPTTPATPLPGGQLGGVTNLGNGSALGEVLPGDVISGGNGRTVIGALTLVSDDATLGGYGFVTGRVTNADGSALATEPETGVGGGMVPGAIVSVVLPFIGNYGAAVQPDGTYRMGLPPGTYTLSAARRNPPDDLTSMGLQAAPTAVTVAAGQTVTQNFTLLASPNASLWGSISGVVNDASGAPAAGQSILIAGSESGPFYAHGLTSQGLTLVGDTNFTDGAYQVDGLVAGDYWVAAASSSSQSDPVKVTVRGGEMTTVPALAVKALPIGSITGTVTDPDGNFGGLGHNIQLKASSGATFTTTTIATPALNGTGSIPQTGVTATYEISNVPVGNYTISLLPSASQGTQEDKSIAVAQGQPTTVDFKATPPAFAEGTADAAISDALKGATDAKWTVADIYETGALDSNGEPIAPPAVPGVMAADGKITTSLQYINGQAPAQANLQRPDAFTFAYQVVPNGDFAISAEVLAVPATDPFAQIGLMIREDIDDAKEVTDSSGNQVTPHNSLAANAFLGVTSESGIIMNGRVGTNLVTFSFGQTAYGTNPNDANVPGTQPELPVSLKLRKVGPAVAGFYSTDGGTTEHFVGSFLPVYATSTLRVGIAITSNVAATEGSGQVQNFSFVKLASSQTGMPGDLNDDKKINVQDATLSLRIAVGLLTPTDAQKEAGDVNNDNKLNIQDTTLILQVAVGNKQVSDLK